MFVSLSGIEHAVGQEGGDFREGDQDNQAHAHGQPERPDTAEDGSHGHVRGDALDDEHDDADRPADESHFQYGRNHDPEPDRAYPELGDHVEHYRQGQHQLRGARIWRIVGDTGILNVAEARSQAAEMLAAMRRGQDAPCEPDQTLFEPVAETVFERYERVWKPGTLYVNQSYLRKQILPHFAGRRIADIDRRDVRNWCASLRATPVAADRSMPVLSVIMREAEAMGYRWEGSNPCQGIKRYRRKGRERFLSDDQIRRLSGILSAHTEERPLQVAVIRLLLLTGCRKGEIVRLRWSEVHDDTLVLADSKTGRRKVPLNTQARRILERQPRSARQFVFPSPFDPSRPRCLRLALWYQVRQEAGIEDVRLHDLRHTHASHAVMNGVPVPVVSRLLGHTNVRMTLRYAHLGDREIEAAAERVGQSMGAMMDI